MDPGSRAYFEKTGAAFSWKELKKAKPLGRLPVVGTGALGTFDGLLSAFDRTVVGEAQGSDDVDVGQGGCSSAMPSAEMPSV